MNYFKFDQVECSERDFLEFWRKYYNEGKYTESIYENNLNKEEVLKKENIEPLLEWKNGKPLPSTKKCFVRLIQENLDEFNRFRTLSKPSDEEVNRFKIMINKIVKSGLVWRVFLLHMARPDDFPIVDQHVLRTYWFLKNQGEIKEPNQNMGTYKDCKNFIFSLHDRTGIEIRKIDQALMAFGQYLNSQFYKK